MRLGFAHFLDKNVQLVYGHGAPDVELEANFMVAHCLGLWGNLNCIWQSGSSDGVSNLTAFDMKTISMGAKLIFCSRWPSVQAYIGIGVLGTYLCVEDRIPPATSQTYRFGGGLLGKSGFHFRFEKNLFLDPFFDYYYQPVSVDDKALITSGDTINMGGFRVGLGLGIDF
ncbi:MAG: hypothetical protein JSS62_04530 [Verrucomicrobia bacterium]|nr:hypothetical protein [Verrucomicrobiota bacterium]MBS0647053.1 hypothetical protein [Verrucomicrobiota bacterium]